MTNCLTLRTDFTEDNVILYNYLKQTGNFYLISIHTYLTNMVSPSLNISKNKISRNEEVSRIPCSRPTPVKWEELFFKLLSMSATYPSYVLHVPPLFLLCSSMSLHMTSMFSPVCPYCDCRRFPTVAFIDRE